MKSVCKKKLKMYLQMSLGVCLSDIDERGWKMKERRLIQDIAKAFQHNALDVLCLSALGQLNESLSPKLEGGIITCIMSLISDDLIVIVRSKISVKDLN